jgi:hypothetical protein
LRFTATKTFTIFITPGEVRRRAAVFRPCFRNVLSGFDGIVECFAHRFDVVHHVLSFSTAI